MPRFGFSAVNAPSDGRVVLRSRATPLRDPHGAIDVVARFGHSPMPSILALDQGTTSSRAIIFGDDGSIRGVAQKEFAQHFPRSGWVEHDPMEIWSTQAATIGGAMAEAGVRPGDLAAIGITNQRETVVVWDRATGRPIHRAIVWQDRRTADACRAIKAAGHDAMVSERTGLLLDPYFSATKIRWILDNVDGARARAERGELAFGTIDTWLLHRLTDGTVHATDPSNASRTLLFNLHTGEWDDELCALFGVPRAMLPEIRPTSGIFGEVTSPLAIGGAPIAAMVGDQQGALAGQGCFAPGQAKCTYGTGCFLLVNTGGAPQVSRHRLLTTVGWRLGAAPLQYALEGSVFIGGAVVQWLRDGLGLIRASADVERLAASVDDSDGVYLVPAFAGLGAPHWDPTARGAIFGLTRGTTAAHLARAAVESIAFQVADLARAMSSETGVSATELHVDGGAAANDALLQFQADLLRVRVVRPKMLETTALGAAFLAGLAVGAFKSTDDAATLNPVDRIFEPELGDGEAAARLERWREAVERSKGWAIEGGDR